MHLIIRINMATYHACNATGHHVLQSRCAVARTALTVGGYADAGDRYVNLHMPEHQLIAALLGHSAASRAA